MKVVEMFQAITYFAEILRHLKNLVVIPEPLKRNLY
jgi:hypothetical protein